MNASEPTVEPVARAVVVLVDPTSPDGETSLGAVRDTDAHVLIVVLTSGRACSALRDRAHDHGISVVSAAWSYLEELALRLSRPDRLVGTIVASGPDAAYELASVVAEHACERVILPASTTHLDRMLARRLSNMTAVTIETATLMSA